jgi:hypothetical protein
VVATEQDALARQAALVRQPQHQVAELRRPKPRVAAFLVDLVGRCLDQRAAAHRARVLERRAQCQRMRRAYGVDSDGFAGPVAAHELEKCLHVASSGSMASRAAATKASTIPSALRGCGTIPSTASAMSAVISGAAALVSGETTIALP